MQGAVCLAKFEYYPDVHDKKQCDLGVLFGSLCQSMESQRHVSELKLHCVAASCLNLRDTCSQILLFNVTFVF